MCISRRHRMKVLHPQGVMTTRPALLGSKGVSTGVALRQRVRQRLGVLEVQRVKPLAEPASVRPGSGGRSLRYTDNRPQVLQR